ncbi:MAG: hypothetical protein HC938_17825 [Nitrospira sp.]|nr:hypothetical protein [Nitrospira sp.]
MAGFAIRSRFAGHPGRSAKTRYALRLKPDHPIGQASRGFEQQLGPRRCTAVFQETVQLYSYTDLADHVARRLARIPNWTLAIDASGLGAPFSSTLDLAGIEHLVSGHDCRGLVVPQGQVGHGREDPAPGEHGRGP